MRPTTILFPCLVLALALYHVAEVVLAMLPDIEPVDDAADCLAHCDEDPRLRAMSTVFHDGEDAHV